MSCFLFLSRSRSRLHDQSSNVTVCFVSYTECNVFVYFITCLKILNNLDPTEKKCCNKMKCIFLFYFPSKVCVLCFSSASQLVINISFKNLTSLQLESMYKRFLQSSLVCVVLFFLRSFLTLFFLLYKYLRKRSQPGMIRRFLLLFCVCTHKGSIARVALR